MLGEMMGWLEGFYIAWIFFIIGKISEYKKSIPKNKNKKNKKNSKNELQTKLKKY